MKAVTLVAATLLAGGFYVVSPVAKADVMFGSLTPTPACGPVSGPGSVCGINETFTSGADLPETMEDVSDIIGIVSPFETPLLDALGDAKRAAASTIHEWLEDTLLPNTDSVNQSSFSPNATDATSITVANGSRFRVGDQVRPDGLRDIMFVTAVAGNVLTGANLLRNGGEGVREPLVGAGALQ